MRIAFTTAQGSVLFIRVARLLLLMSAAVFVYWLEAGCTPQTRERRPERITLQGSPSSRLKVVNLHLAKTGPGQEEESTE
jgi:hypothetical protein